jgi:16S rRNA pseudouridine516 synthase
MSKAERLRADRLLANLGYGSRREVRRLIEMGSVTLEGVPLTDPEQRLLLDDQLRLHLLVEGEALDPLPGQLTLAMNKPAGYSCSRSEEGRIIYDLLPARWRARVPALSTAGRLDKETSGLLLFTDDGELLHRITSPKKEIVKKYLVELERPLRGFEADLFASGTLMLDGEKKPLLPASLQAHSPNLVTVSIREGRYHQVRRMFAATDNCVVKLKRESIGGLVLAPQLKEGAFQLLGHEELSLVFSG